MSHPTDSDEDADVFDEMQLTKEEIIKCHKTAQKKVLTDMFITNIRTQFEERGYLHSMINVPKRLQDVLLDERARCQTKPPYWFVTVNPRPDVTFEQLSNQVCKYVTSVTVKHYFYVYEVRKADFTGMHAHILLHTTMLPAAFKRQTQNCFKKICDYTNCHILNMKNIDESIVPDKINYMLGEKKDLKLAGVDFSVKWRNENYIEQYYEPGPGNKNRSPFTCRATQKNNS